MTSSPVLKKCTKDDMLRLFTIFSKSFGKTHEHLNASFPDHWTDEGRRNGRDHFLKSFERDTNIDWLKVEVDGEMVAGAKWIMYDGGLEERNQSCTQEGESRNKNIIRGGIDHKNQEKGKYNDANEYAAYLRDIFLRHRRETIEQSSEKILCLDLMCVDPAWQRKGFGIILLKWGLDKADKLGIEAVLEATDAGRRLYGKNGFEDVEHCVIEMPEKWKDRPRQSFWWMRRPKRNS